MLLAAYQANALLVHSLVQQAGALLPARCLGSLVALAV